MQSDYEGRTAVVLRRSRRQIWTFKVNNQAHEYWTNEGLDRLVAKFDEDRSSPFPPIAPDISDLVRLHKLARERRRLTVVEFGTGYSAIVLAHALQRSAVEHSVELEALELGWANPFRLYSVDANSSWINSVERALPATLADRVSFVLSPVIATTFDGRLCHLFQNLPDIVPDLVYVDGPDPSDVQGDINNLSFEHGRVPMSADVLLMEPTLLPGTIVVFDGRVANARFVLRHLDRPNSVYRESDVTIIEFVDQPLGLRDERRRKFQSGG